MSENLALIIVKPEKIESESVLGYERLRLNIQDDQLYHTLNRVAVPFLKKLHNYEDEGLRTRATDSFNRVLSCLNAYILADHLQQMTLDEWDTAVLNFLKSLPPMTLIVLWWY